MTNAIQLLQRVKFQENEGGDGDPKVDDSTPAPKNDGEGDGGKVDDGNKPSDREAELLKEVMKRKDDLKAARREAEELRSNLKKFEGINLDEVTALLQERKDRERTEMEKRGEFDRVKEQMVTEHTSALESLRTSYEEKLAAQTAELEKTTSLITELTIGRAFGDSGFVRDTLTLTPSKARVVYGSHFELQDGKVVAYDKPAGAPDRTVLVDGMGDPLAFDQAIEKIVKADPDHEHLVRSKVKPGAGSKNDSSTPAKPKVGSGRDRIGAAIAAGALKR